MALGTWPSTPLVKARQRCHDARCQLEAGIDPQDQRDQVIREATTLSDVTEGYGSVETLFQLYIANLQRQDKRSWHEQKRSLDLDALPVLGAATPCRGVTPDQIREILHRLISRGAAVQSNRVRSYLYTAFEFARLYDNDPRQLKTGLKFALEKNPVADVPKDHSAEHASERVLSWDELAKIWNDPLLEQPAQQAIRLILGTGGQRPGEITEAAWNEFDFDTGFWILPAQRARKADRDHLIPLNPFISEILMSIRVLDPESTWLFPACPGTKADRPWGKSKLPHIIRSYCKLADMTPWVPRDLRRTAKTLMRELGVSKFDRDRIQNHAINDVSGQHYDRYDYLEEKRKGLDLWCGRLERISKS